MIFNTRVCATERHAYVLCLALLISTPHITNAPTDSARKISHFAKGQVRNGNALEIATLSASAFSTAALPQLRLRDKCTCCSVPNALQSTPRRRYCVLRHG